MIFLWTQTIASLCMLVVIILVQYLVYPQFAQVGENELSVYAKSHVRAITWIVAPLMIIESLSLIALWFDPKMRSTWLLIASLCLLSIWLLTFMKLVPTHDLLIKNSDPTQIATLLKANTYRMGLWMIKFIVIALLLTVILAPKIKTQFVYHTAIDDAFEKPNGYQMELEKGFSKQAFFKAIDDLNPEIVLDTGDVVRMIIRTPQLKFPDLLIVQFGQEKTVLRSQSLLGYSDLGTNQKRLEAIASLLKD